MDTPQRTTPPTDDLTWRQKSALRADRRSLRGPIVTAIVVGAAVIGFSLWVQHAHEETIREREEAERAALMAASAPLRDAVRAALSGPGPTATVDLGGGVTMEFVLVPAGTFRMGADYDPSANPAHEVTVTKPFWLARTEVTQAQWEAVTGASPSGVRGADPTLPVGGVSWTDAALFCERLGLRLPTEAEWELACRAGTTTQWSFGDDPEQVAAHAWTRETSGMEPRPVGLLEPNPLGFLDMHGGVMEWCADFERPYPAGAATDPTGPPASWTRAARGGSWMWPAGESFSSSRRGQVQDYRGADMGLRPAASAAR